MLSLMLAPCIPSWLARQREAGLQIEEAIVNCVGFIGAPSNAGFVADGTCFFVAYEEDTETFEYLVTARHLVRPMRFGKETLPLDGTVSIRFSRKTKPPRIVETRRDSWLVPADRHLDLAIRPWDYRAIDPDYELNVHSIHINGDQPVLLTPALEQMFGKIGIGDDIFIPSLFPGHTGERRNIPLVRIGNIAAAPLESVQRGSPTAPAYLIETKSLGGISGAPVFLHLQPHRARNLPKHDSAPGTARGFSVPYALIGFVLGIHGGRYAADFIETDEDEAIISKDADFNAGISVVLPIQHVIDLLESESMKTSRKASLEAIDKNSGYRPASARTYPSRTDVAPETNPDENPAHQEDFTALVGVTSKPKPKDDRT